MLNNVTSITKDHLLSAAAALLPQGYRFVTMTCIDLGPAHDLIYTFEKNQELNHLRLRLNKGEELPSISAVSFAATLAENEIQDLFGIPVQGTAIDYQGRFLLAEGAPRAPLNKTGSQPEAENRGVPE